MGKGPSKPTAERESSMEYLEEKVGRVALNGRYHRLPRRIEDDYEILNKVLGRGAFSVVKQAMAKGGSTSYAVKALPTKSLSRESKAQLEVEVDVCLGMDHRHVVRLFDVYEAEHYLHLVMECMEGKELFDRVTERKRFSEYDAAETVRQMLLAINYLHANGIVHRDLKLENFLYTKLGSDHLKLIDFGFAKVWDPSVKMNVGCGTLAYCAPEVLKRSYTNKADLWSVGVIAFILLAGYMPFIDSNDITVAILAGKYTIKEDRWSSVSKEARHFMMSLLTVDVEKRLSASQALNHPWILKREEMNKVSIEPEVVEGLRQFGSASRFRRACMEMMAWSLTYEERELVAKQFLAMDKEKKGTITMGEFKQCLAEQFSISDEETQQIFEAMDSNSDHTIHYTDFLAAMLNTRIKLHSDLLMKTFKRFDKANTGYITVENLVEIFGGDTFQGEQVEALFKEADLRKDGKISYKEFVAYLTNQPLDPTEFDTAVRDASLRVIDLEVRRMSSKGVETGMGPSLSLHHVDLSNKDLPEAHRSEGQDPKGMVKEKKNGASQGCACTVQ